MWRDIAKPQLYTLTGCLTILANFIDKCLVETLLSFAIYMMQSQVVADIKFLIHLN